MGYNATSQRMRKRRKTTKTRRIRVTRKAASEPPEESPSDPDPFVALLQALTQVAEITEEPTTFEEFIEPLLPDLIEASAIAQVQRIKNNEDVCILKLLHLILFIFIATPRDTKSFR